MRRLLALLPLILVLLPATCVHMERPTKANTPSLQFTAVTLDASQRKAARALAPLRLERIWRIESSYRYFGGYSALVAPVGEPFLAISDVGAMLRFSDPDGPESPPIGGQLLGKAQGPKTSRDFESATANPSGTLVWAGMEFENAIMRFGQDSRGRLVSQAVVRPAAMADWANNSGPEALVRLRDGSFLTLCEGFTGLLESRRHRALRFRADPIEAPDAERFIMEGPAGFSPTDMAQMPDGRVLVLFRRLQWPMPPRFAGAIAIGDPQSIRTGKTWRLSTIAEWGSGLPRDNFEGLAITPGRGGRLTIWLISDDNRSALQQTMLWKLSVDPRALPDAR